MLRVSVAAAIALVGAIGTSLGEQPTKGSYSFGPDQTIADIGLLTWAPLKLDGLPEGIEIATLRGDLAKGGGEILLRTPPGYVVPNHSHTSDELYDLAEGAVHVCRCRWHAATDERASLYQSTRKHTSCTQCGSEQCVFYLRYGRPFDLQVHSMPAPK